MTDGEKSERENSTVNNLIHANYSHYSVAHARYDKSLNLFRDYILKFVRSPSRLEIVVRIICSKGDFFDGFFQQRLLRENPSNPAATRHVSSAKQFCWQIVDRKCSPARRQHSNRLAFVTVSISLIWASPPEIERTGNIRESVEIRLIVARAWKISRPRSRTATVTSWVAHVGSCMRGFLIYSRCGEERSNFLKY